MTNLVFNYEFSAIDVHQRRKCSLCRRTSLPLVTTSCFFTSDLSLVDVVIGSQWHVMDTSCLIGYCEQALFTVSDIFSKAKAE